MFVFIFYVFKESNFLLLLDIILLKYMIDYLEVGNDMGIIKDN